jgi:hypothetical protein
MRVPATPMMRSTPSPMSTEREMFSSRKTNVTASVDAIHAPPTARSCRDKSSIDV